MLPWGEDAYLMLPSETAGLIGAHIRRDMARSLYRFEIQSLLSPTANTRRFVEDSQLEDGSPITFDLRSPVGMGWHDDPIWDAVTGLNERLKGDVEFLNFVIRPDSLEAFNNRNEPLYNFWPEMQVDRRQVPHAKGEGESYVFGGRAAIPGHWGEWEAHLLEDIVQMRGSQNVREALVHFHDSFVGAPFNSPAAKRTFGFQIFLNLGMSSGGRDAWLHHYLVIELYNHETGHTYCFSFKRQIDWGIQRG